MASPRDTLQCHLCQRAGIALGTVVWTLPMVTVAGRVAMFMLCAPL